jgi:hypothetical protein
MQHWCRQRLQALGEKGKEGGGIEGWGEEAGKEEREGGRLH